MEILLGEGKNKIRRYLYPYVCNTDEMVFEALEDCHHHWQTFMMFTSGGTGKTSFIASYVQREWVFFPRSHSIITSSSDTPATQMMKFVEDSIDAAPIELTHDRYPYNRFKNFTASTRRKDGTVDTELSYQSVVEKIIFGDNSGATRSKRPTILVFEEIGNWTGGASLIDCYNASMARGQIGGEASCFYAMIGTGGHTRNNVISDVKEMIDAPEAFNLYLCDPWKAGDKNIFFIPAYKKATGFYEQTGIMDEEGARKKFEARRETKKGNARALLAEKREFPFTLKECFLKEITGGIFYPDKLEYQSRRILENPDDETILRPKRGFWIWNYKKNYPDFVEKADGPVWMFEPPIGRVAQEGYRPVDQAYFLVTENLYIGGYDGIDFSNQDATTQTGSKGAMLIKKRTTPLSMSNNFYACRICWRPDGIIDELYEQVLFSCIAYNCKINIEYSKIGIKKYFESHKQGWRLLRRPKSMMGNALENQLASGRQDLIGSQPTPANINYGIGLLQIFVFHYYLQLYDTELIDQLREFTYEEKGLFDLIMAAIWCEVADEALPVYQAEAVSQMHASIGWYIDPVSGLKHFGLIPQQLDTNLGYTLSNPNNFTGNGILIDAHLYSRLG